MAAQRGDHIDVDLAGVDHLRHLEHLGRGHPATGHHLGFEPHPPRQGARLGAAAVDHEHPDREGLQQRHLHRDVVERFGRRQHLAAELEHEDLFPIEPGVLEGVLESVDEFGHFSPLFESMVSSTARWTWSRFSAWSVTRDHGPSRTPSVTTTLRRTGRQWRKIPAPSRVEDIRLRR